jgi:hypothetical protein
MKKPLTYNENVYFFQRDRELIHEMDEKRRQVEHRREMHNHVGHCTACGEDTIEVTLETAHMHVCPCCHGVFLEGEAVSDLLRRDAVNMVTGGKRRRRNNAA